MALDELRAEIDRADRDLSAAFVRRMEIAAQIAAYKRENGLPVLDSAVRMRWPHAWRQGATRAWPPTWSGCTARCLP